MKPIVLFLFLALGACTTTSGTGGSNPTTKADDDAGATCGAVDGPCCANGTCSVGLCIHGACRDYCSVEGTCPRPNFVCFMDICMPDGLCGTRGGACCSEGEPCASGLTCLSGSCWEPNCGQEGERCCAYGSECARGLNCTSGTCQRSPILFDGWSCPIEFRDTRDGCDCNCGAHDPDCDVPDQVVIGCETGQSCTDGLCTGVPENWSCSPEFFGTRDGCDCNCGAHDPDCDLLERDCDGADPNCDSWRLPGAIGCDVGQSCILGECSSPPPAY